MPLPFTCDARALTLHHLANYLRRTLFLSTTISQYQLQTHPLFSPTMSDVDSDYEHWPDNASMYSSKTVAATGYNNRNGLHEHQYQRADSDDLKKRTKAAVPPHLVAQAPTHVCYQARPQAPLPSPYMMQAGTPYTCYPGAYYGMPCESHASPVLPGHAD